jgi:hypothetical protein
VSYDPEPCEGRQASPSNPSKVGGFEATIVFRCTALEKTTLQDQASRSRTSLSMLVREALGLAKTPRRLRPMPKADPELLRSVGRLCGDLGTIARRLQPSPNGGLASLEAMLIVAELVAIERTLSDLIGSKPTKTCPASEAPC